MPRRRRDDRCRSRALTPDQLSTYIAVNADGTVAAYFGKMDMGQGLFVAVGQIVAEELDVPFDSVKVFMGDTATSVNQGGASGSTGIQEGGKQMRIAAAEARRVLVADGGRQARRAGRSADGDATASFTPTAMRRRKVSYAELIGGRYFNVHLDWNGKYGNPLYAPGKAQPKDPKDHTDRRPADQARGHRAESVRAAGLLHRRQSARHGAWPHDPAGGRRRGAGQGRRKLDQGYSRRQSGLEQGLPRRRRRQGMGRDQGRRSS